MKSNEELHKEIYEALSNYDNLTDAEKAEINAKMKRNHRKYKISVRYELFLAWLRANWIQLLTLIATIATLIVAIIGLVT